jgi:nucleoside-diphosphate-sugar epimerase
MRAVVTGAAGFVGSHLVESLIKAGHEVTCVIRKDSNARWLTEIPCTVMDCGMDSPNALKSVVSNTELIFHVAGVTKAFHSQGYHTGNVDIARNLAEAVRLYGNNVKALVAVSSQAAGGPSNGEQSVVEAELPRPVSFYGQAKLEAENILLGLCDIINVGIVRPSMVYGPRDGAFVPLYRGAAYGLFPVPGRADMPMSIIHVADLVRGIKGLAEALLDGRVDNGQVYYLSGQTATWEEIARAIGRAVGKRQWVLPVPLWLIRSVAVVNELAGRMGLPTNHLVTDKWREAKQPGWVCSHDRAKDDFGYQPELPLESGLSSTVAWCREQGWLR